MYLVAKINHALYMVSQR